MSYESPKRPLRKVVLRCARGQHVLECGHRLGLRYTAYGMSTTQKRCRCDACAYGSPRDYTDEQLSALSGRQGLFGLGPDDSEAVSALLVTEAVGQ